MNTLLIAVFALTAAPSADGGDAPDIGKTARELRAAVHASLSAEAQAPDRHARLEAVADLVRVYGELKTNENLAYRDRVRYRAKIRSRLVRVASDMERQLGKKQTAGKTTLRAPTADASGGQLANDPERALIELIESTLRPSTWKSPGDAGVMAGGGPGAAVAGGPRAVGGGGFGGGMAGGGLGNAKAEQAEALIELIRTTIRPESWDVNGGRGSIMCWPGS